MFQHPENREILLNDVLQSHSLSPNQSTVGSTHWVPDTDISGIPRFDRDFRDMQQRCTTQTQM